ncbi:LAME_0G18976g1_1 [Lachancea meyersii CBS 8951]|uniref:U3 small nucleolar RNA-associated protein 10 n=1 Tax=Lachancea meyersii CBS 8951 TaxID=1266667 RepID=A0A1G4KC12_9SACH|nr:LAME_0G18976g1_1 [Lachancea meyersii CBS 8951]
MSLSDQLAQVAANNATVAFDRKKRQKLHSASLIYNPNTAATQDFDFIYENAISSLEELIEVDSRFAVFQKSLFGTSSATIDRNVQTKDQIRDLDHAVNLYLILASSKWHLTPTLHATEWLVRRFQIHVHNAECLLLSTIDYYQTPVFKRILNIVKLPPLFNALSNFVRTDRSPSSLTIIKLFSDMDFLKVYTQYLSKVIEQKVAYTNQLLFTTCSFINLIAFKSGNIEVLNALVPTVLEICAKLLASDSADCQIAAHTILVVFGTALPLKKEILIAAAETILANLKENKAKRSAFISIGKLFQTLKGHGNVDQMPIGLYKLFDSKFSFQSLIDQLRGSDELVMDKFLTSYIRSILRYDHQKLDSLVSLFKVIKLESFEIKLIVLDLINLSEVFDDKRLLVEIFEYFVALDEDRVIKCLHSLNLSPELFELRLTTSLFRAKEDAESSLRDLEASKVLGANSHVEPFKDFLNKNSRYIITKVTSMLIEGDEKFSKLLSLYVEAVSKGFKAGLFLSSFFTTVEGRLTFLLRVIISPAAPTALRLESLSNFSKSIHQIGQDSNLFSLVPILIAALHDTSKSVRNAVKKILHQISKRPSTKHYFLANKLYGDVEIPMVSPKDAESWMNKFLDEYMIENHNITNLVIPKKLEKVFMVFWANQAIHMPLPHAKTIFIKFITGHKSYNSSYSSLFEKMLVDYLEQRETWEKTCINNKTNFESFENAIASIISIREKNMTIIGFAEKCLKCDFEQLARLVSGRLLGLFPTLKLSHQQQLVKDVVDSTAERELSYDSVEFLQSIPLSSEIFVFLLSQYRINATGDEAGDFAKKRRRRSSTANKAALQREEVSQIAELHLRKLTLTLEALDLIKPEGSEPLLSTLFSTLSDLETLDQDGGLPVLYAQETLSSCMISVISSMPVESKSQLRLLRADILVSAITSSNSPQVQNKLLLVIGELAKLSPEIVLHSVMPIFIFMGAKTIRQDDEYSSYVVERTIQLVVPALLHSKSSNSTEETEFLLTSFGTAFTHVPRHRRVKLFTTLVKTLGSDIALGPFLFLIAQQYSSSVQKYKVSESKTVLEFTKAFLTKFSVLDQLIGIHALFTLLNTLSENWTEDSKAQLASRTLFSNGILNASKSEVLAIKKNGFKFLDSIIVEGDADFQSSGNLKVRVMGALWDSSSEKQLRDDVKSRFGEFLKTTLDSLNTSASLVSLPFDNQEPFASGELDEMRDAIREILFQILGHVLDLLPIEEFVSATLPLISADSSLDTIKHRLILVLSSKFDLEPIESVTHANRVIEALYTIIDKESKNDGIVQVSLNTLESLIAKYGDKIESGLITKGMSIASELLLSQKMEIEISSLAVLTSGVQALGVKAIAFYPKIVGPAVQIFKALETSEADVKEQLQLAIILVFASMVKRIPAFLLSNLVDVFRVVFFADEVENTVRLSVISLIVEHIDLKEVMRALYKVWLSDVCKTGDSAAISLFLSALESTVDTIDKKIATSESPVFFRLLLSLFEYRSTSDFDHNTISRIEASVHNVANAYVLKLNDKVFRPLFALMVRWAFDGEGVTNDTISRTERLTAFFKFFGRLQENLKAIVTSYFTYLLDATVELLRSFSKGEVSNSNLRRLVLHSLTSCFKYDRDEYWKSTSRFEVISEALVAQLPNIEPPVGRYLVKAISSLAMNNAGADEHNKTMNTMLISHMKSNCSSSEKLWAVKTVKTIYSKVGEGWLSFLPQLVPIIAELLEDDDEGVEYEVRSGLVKVVENVLGEPLDRYLD